jgi:hypothetical protein
VSGDHRVSSPGMELEPVPGPHTRRSAPEAHPRDQRPEPDRMGCHRQLGDRASARPSPEILRRDDDAQQHHGISRHPRDPLHDHLLEGQGPWVGDTCCVGGGSPNREERDDQRRKKDRDGSTMHVLTLVEWTHSSGAVASHRWCNLSGHVVGDRCSTRAPNRGLGTQRIASTPRSLDVPHVREP